MNNREISKIIALCGIATAFGVIFILIGVFVPLLDMAMFMTASMCLMLPLYKNYLKGAALTYVCISVLAFLFSGANFFAIMPYIIFFGYHPILNYLQMKFKIDVKISVAINCLIFNIAFYFIFNFSKIFIDSDILDKIPYVLLAVFATVIFIIYDLAFKNLQLKANQIFKRFIK